MQTATRELATLEAPTETSAKETILLVEDNLDQAALVRRWLERDRGAHVVHADNAEMAARLLESWDWSLVISDIELPGMDGLELVRQCRAAMHWTPTLVITAHESFTYAQRALQNKADDLLIKPLTREPFLQRVDALVRG
ncbi:MAG: response regulator, partial [Acidobacteriota bacterium]|nr:response regulator [Acidobacteriota bacterium]